MLAAGQYITGLTTQVLTCMTERRSLRLAAQLQLNQAQFHQQDRLMPLVRRLSIWCLYQIPLVLYLPLDVMILRAYMPLQD